MGDWLREPAEIKAFLREALATQREIDAQWRGGGDLGIGRVICVVQTRPLGDWLLNVMDLDGCPAQFWFRLYDSGAVPNLASPMLTATRFKLSGFSKTKPAAAEAGRVEGANTLAG